MPAQPASIRNFEKLFWAAMLLSVINIMINLDYIKAMMLKEPEFAAYEQMIGPLIIGSIIIGLSINLCLWFFIAVRPSRIAKWIYTGLAVYGVIASFVSVSATPASMLLLGLAGTALNAASAYMLFRRDSIIWFGGTPQD